jgi:N-acetylglucosamine kinase-like BadF-type ATPase
MAEPADDGVVVGVDGGGTKTDVVVVGRDGTVLGACRAGPGNWEAIGLDAMRETLAAALRDALAAADVAPSRVAVSAFALAGCDWPTDEARIDAELTRLGLSGERVVVNDSFAALRAGATRPYGVVSIAGTGGCTSGRGRDGATFRTMAVSWGEGSGAWSLVRAAAHAIAREYHGHEVTQLTPRLLEALGFASTPAFFEALTRGQRTVLGPQLAPLVLQAASEGDAVATQIVEQVAHQHAADVVGVARRLALLDTQFEVVRAGGVHRAGHAEFDTAFEVGVLAAATEVEFVRLAVPPVVGAALLALDAVGCGDAGARDRLTATTTADQLDAFSRGSR